MAYEQVVVIVGVGIAVGLCGWGAVAAVQALAHRLFRGEVKEG